MPHLPPRELLHLGPAWLTQEQAADLAELLRDAASILDSAEQWASMLPAARRHLFVLACRFTAAGLRLLATALHKPRKSLPR